MIRQAEQSLEAMMRKQHFPSDMVTNVEGDPLPHPAKKAKVAVDARGGRAGASAAEFSDDDSQHSNMDEEASSELRIQHELVEYISYRCNAADNGIFKLHGLLFWWKTYQQKFPFLSRVARSVLAIPASSAKSENLFSDAGNTMSKKRNLLDPDKLDDMMFLRSMIMSKGFNF
jgi:hypothetical protein